MQCTLLYTGDLVSHIVMVFSSFSTLTFNSLSSLPPLYEVSSCLSFCTLLFVCLLKKLRCHVHFFSNWTIWAAELKSDICCLDCAHSSLYYNLTSVWRNLNNIPKLTSTLLNNTILNEGQCIKVNSFFFFHFIAQSIFPYMHQICNLLSHRYRSCSMGGIPLVFWSDCSHTLHTSWKLNIRFRSEWFKSELRKSDLIWSDLIAINKTRKQQPQTTPRLHMKSC